MNETLYSIFPSTAILGVAALVALRLTLTRSARGAASRRLLRLSVLTLGLQSLHFAEEWGTGLHERLPELFGFPPWPVAFFVSFNLFWMAVWGLSIGGLRAQVRAAFFPLWFLGIACAANGLLHPLLSVAAGGYFPGLLTSPLVGITGVLLLRGLASFTQAERALL